MKKVKKVALALVFLGACGGVAAQTPPMAGVQLLPGNYDGSFGEGGKSWGTRLTVVTAEEGRVVGSVILYTGICPGVPRPFTGSFEGGRLVGKTNGPAECVASGRVDVAVDVKLEGGLFRGVFDSNRQYNVTFGGVRTAVIPGLGVASLQ